MVSFIRLSNLYTGFGEIVSFLFIFFMDEVIFFNILAENLAVAKSILDAEKIPYFVKGETSSFGITGGFGYNPAFPVQIGVSLKDKESVGELLEGL